MRFKAVLLDWRGTLAYVPPEQEWVRCALGRLGRDVSDAAATWHRIEPHLDRLEADGVDSNAAMHRQTYFDVFRSAGLDQRLAETLYDLEGDASLNPFADDVAEMLAAVRALGVRIAVISDIHFDLRPAFVAAGLNGFVDAYVLSYEEGVQKPTTQMFTQALGRLGVAAQEAVMVGDRSGYDGAAVELGIVTLLLPPLRSATDCRLHLVEALLRG